MFQAPDAARSCRALRLVPGASGQASLTGRSGQSAALAPSPCRLSSGCPCLPALCHTCLFYGLERDVVFLFTVPVLGATPGEVR